MKQMKRWLSMLLVAALLLGYIPPVTVSAAESEISALVPGEAAELTLAPGETRTYHVEITESSFYAVDSPHVIIDNSYYAFSHYLELADGGWVRQEIMSGNTAYYYLEAGSTYAVVVDNDWDFEITSEIILTKCPQPTAVEINYEVLSHLWTGEEYSNGLGVTFQPEGAFDAVTWSLPENDVIRMDGAADSQIFSYTFIGTGETTLTVTPAGGLTDTCSMVSKEPETLALGQDYALTLNPEEEVS